MYLSWSTHAREALEAPIHNARKLEVDNVLVVGMGGSAIVGDFLAYTTSNEAVQIMVWKDRYVPRCRGRTLVLAISYSGKTLETIAAVYQAMSKGLPVAVVTSGGKLLEIAQKNGLPYIIVRRDLVPRAALASMLFASIALLKELGIELYKEKEIEEAINILEKHVSEAEEVAVYLATFLAHSQIPLVVATTRYAPLAVRIKNEINENAKMPCKVEIAPELFHNDIVGWETANSGRAIFVESEDPVERAMLTFYADFLASKGFENFMLSLRGEHMLARYLYGSLVAGLATVRVAQIRGVDPLKTESIARYKEFLKSIESKLVRLCM